MDKMRLLITGGSGLLALNWAYVLRKQYNIILGVHTHSVDLAGTSMCMLNLDDIEELDSQLEKLSPDIIVHTAGLTSVDLCEKSPVLANYVNAELAKNIATVAFKRGIKLIHISTDHLFQGNKSFYSEEIEPNPVNEYGKSKYLAERVVSEINRDAIIIRTNFFCWGYSGRQSFSDWIIYNLRDDKPLSMFDDVFITPILADSLILNTQKLVSLGASGIYHLVGDERISKYDFACRLAERFNLPAKLISRNKIADANLLALRPYDMSLSNKKASEKLNIEIGGLDYYFSDLSKQEIQGRSKELFYAVSLLKK